MQGFLHVRTVEVSPESSRGSRYSNLVKSYTRLVPEPHTYIYIYIYRFTYKDYHLTRTARPEILAPLPKKKTV